MSSSSEPHFLLFLILDYSGMIDESTCLSRSKYGSDHAAKFVIAILPFGITFIHWLAGSKTISNKIPWAQMSIDFRYANEPAKYSQLQKGWRESEFQGPSEKIKK